ncbi:MAG: hypothetical protein ACK5QC_06080 [Bacteroidota bacterium]|jgi:hypothetical protein
MKKTIKYILFINLLFFALTCKKKPDGINIKAIDPFMNQPIAYAKVGLIERELKGGLFSGGYNCKIIKQLETDANGNAFMNNVKFKTNKSIDYFITVLNAYGKDLSYSCGNHKESDLLQKTNNTINKTVYAYGRDIDWKINLNKLYSQNFGGLNTDSIIVKVYRDYGYFDDLIDNWNGSKQFVQSMVLNKKYYQSLYNPSNPETYTCCTYNYLNKIFPGNYKIEVTKNKNGILTSYSYNELVSPHVNIYYFNIDW